MIVLLDTNIIGRLSQPAHDMHTVVAQASERLVQEGHALRVVPQVLYEFWAIATRSVSENGLGFSVDQAATEIDRIKAVFPPLRDERAILDPWESLVRKYEVRGKKTHDARLVAAMLRHGVTQLLTFNASDFKRFQEIEVLEPMAYLAK